MKIVAISDTHTLHAGIAVPEADVLVHTGDFTGSGTPLETLNFLNWYEKQPHKHKIIVLGNHERGFEKNWNLLTSFIPDSITLLHDSSIVIDGLKFYGSPWQPEFCNWAFNLPRNGPELKAKWDAIPDNTDVLLTHGPPHGILDEVRYALGNRVLGCEMLRKRIDNLNLKAHIFGHIHDSYGQTKSINTQFVNASICTEHYEPINDPIVIEV